MYCLQIEGRAKTGSIANRRRILFALIVFVIIVADQYTKSLATIYLSNGSIVKPFGGDFVWLVYVLNPGFAFGMRILPPLVLKIFAGLAAIALGYYLFTRSEQSLIQNLGLTLIMGGAIGNLIDRIRIGEVIDFLSLNMPDFIMDRFPVFNVADAMVSVGVVLLFFYTMFLHEPTKATLDSSSVNTTPDTRISQRIDQIDPSESDANDRRV